VRAQASIEYLSVISIALLISAPFVIEAQNSIGVIRSDSNVIQLEQSLDRLQVAAETVNAAGEPAKRSLRFTVPETVNSSEIVEKRQVRYILNTPSGTRQVDKIFEFNVTGQLPGNPGRYLVEVRANSSEVEVGVVS
jgi:hypothetical protein